MSAHAHPNDADGTLLDAIQFEAWCGLVHWLLGKPWAHAAFQAETGLSRAGGRTPLDAAIDEATGYTTVYIGEFVRWVTRDHWGVDEVTPSIQAALDRFPRRQ